MENYEADEVLEERDGIKGIGTEYEDLGETDSDLIRPWDPNEIRVDPKTYSLRNILDMIDEGDLDLDPDFQRRRVWTKDQRSRLIESILLRIPLPAFYFSSNEDGKLQVVDGLQRLSTIHDFVRGGHRGIDNSFKLSGLEYLDSQVGNKTFKELEGSVWSRRIYSTQITVNVVDPQTPDPVKFDIFRRINTGGTPLNQQEIRHCMSGERSRKFLAALTDLDNFQAATGGALTNHVRMADREVVLRFTAFASLGHYSAYERIASMAELLNSTTKAIDESMPDSHLDDLFQSFDQAMFLSYALFGDFAFRKWPSGSYRRFPLSRPLFEVWSVLLSVYDWDLILERKDDIVEQARVLMAEDVDFVRSISVSTGSSAAVLKRFSAVDEILKSVL